MTRPASEIRSAFKKLGWSAIGEDDHLVARHRDHVDVRFEATRNGTGWRVRRSWAACDVGLGDGMTYDEMEEELSHYIARRLAPAAPAPLGAA